MRLKGQYHAIFASGSFHEFPPAPEYPIRTVSNVVKAHHATGINANGGKFPTGVNDSLMVYSGAWGKLIHEKNRSRKSRDFVPLWVTEKTSRIIATHLIEVSKRFVLVFFVKQGKSTVIKPSTYTVKVKLYSIVMLSVER
jgi:hypothetical protein